MAIKSRKDLSCGENIAPSPPVPIGIVVLVFGGNWNRASPPAFPYHPSPLTLLLFTWKLIVEVTTRMDSE